MIVLFKHIASESRPAVRPRANLAGRGVGSRFAPRPPALGSDEGRINFFLPVFS
jgi:hypothetical protein